MPMQANVFNVDVRLFGMVIQADFLVFLGRDCLGEDGERKSSHEVGP